MMSQKQAKQTATPIPAATIIIGRDRPGGFEVFMVVRHHEIDFAAGALVFPGGKISEADKHAEIRDYCDDADNLDDKTLWTMIAAIRETFEECGILLMRPQGDPDIVSSDRLKTLNGYRKKLHSDEISLLEFLKQEKLTPALDQLQLFAHWIAPEIAPKRFDTFFYLARAPEDHLAIHDGTESVDSVWIKPADVLMEHKEGKRSIMFPTRMNITKLSGSQTVEE
ncbi:NUDIX hydrolase, partial [bacterium]|nr:NUDIX hydrolase [bacterium]